MDDQITGNWKQSPITRRLLDGTIHHVTPTSPELLPTDRDWLLCRHHGFRSSSVAGTAYFFLLPPSRECSSKVRRVSMGLVVPPESHRALRREVVSASPVSVLAALRRLYFAEASPESPTFVQPWPKTISSGGPGVRGARGRPTRRIKVLPAGVSYLSVFFASLILFWTRPYYGKGGEWNDVNEGPVTVGPGGSARGAFAARRSQGKESWCLSSQTSSEARKHWLDYIP